MWSRIVNDALIHKIIQYCQCLNPLNSYVHNVILIFQTSIEMDYIRVSSKFFATIMRISELSPIGPEPHEEGNDHSRVLSN